MAEGLAVDKHVPMESDLDDLDDFILVYDNDFSSHTSKHDPTEITAVPIIATCADNSVPVDKQSKDDDVKEIGDLFQTFPFLNIFDETDVFEGTVVKDNVVQDIDPGADKEDESDYIDELNFLFEESNDGPATTTASLKYVTHTSHESNDETANNDDDCFGLFDDDDSNNDDENDDDEDETSSYQRITQSAAECAKMYKYSNQSDNKTKTKVELNTPSKHGRESVTQTLELETDMLSNYKQITNAAANKGVERAISEEDFCCICLDTHTNPKILHKCSHKFCAECIEQHFAIKPVCPVCFVAYGVVTGNQPKGHMEHSVSKNTRLPGYEKHDTIVVSYGFPDGIQTEEHPNPGQLYSGTSRTGYLPNNEEGQKVLRLLKESFKRRLTFTVGRSRTTGCDNVVTWNDIHHKTCTHGGQQSFGYPDPTYLQRVQEELAAFGVTEESLGANK